MTAVVFSPSKNVMNVDEVQRKGYAIANTPTRLVLRSPHNAEETYLQNVAGVPMRVLSTSTFFEQKWLVTRVDATAVCPTPVAFTPEVITWYMPKHIDPLFSSDAFTMLEVYMGIDAKRLDTEEMAARNYSVLVTEAHIIVEIPVGAVGGYFKVSIGLYFVTYTIEPMLELLWIEEVAHEDTSYKVLFPITTPLMARPPQVHTVPEQAVFVLELGTFNLDVELLNITFPTMVLTVAECNARGFNVREQRSPDNTLKTFRLEVPFSDPVRRAEQGVTTFTLQLIYGLVIFPEYAPFSHSAVVDAVLLDIVPPSVTGNCDQENFHITVDYRNQEPFFVVLVGKRLLNHEFAQQYLTEGDTDFTITLPFSSPDAVFELASLSLPFHSSSVRSRLDVALLNPYNNMTIKYFSLACSFLKTLTECFSNGTMTALAVKVESAPGLNPGQLTLSDPACGPTYSDDRVAYFHFTVNSCGTTRKFINNVMLYENEISLPDELEVKRNATTSSGEEYQLKVSCYYVANITRTLAFLTRPRDNEPFAATGTGRLMVRMRLAQDASYNTFHQEEDYPVVRYLRQPLHFEVALTTSSDPKVALVLDHCWATLNEDRDSRPRWNLIINGCENPEDPYRVVFHPVVADARVHFPPHVKRFEAYMFSFAEDALEPSGQVFVHCDVVICDASSPSGGPCSGQCVNQDNPKRGRSCFMLFRPWQTITELIGSLSTGQRHVKDLFEERHLYVSSGYILWV
uniref:ZP domain-containing protein n=1 Tax=Oncorhynchus mykiss TaxID=8022 RepID=A0A8C7SEN3_ONCMY